MLVLNFKTYPESTGQKSTNLLSALNDFLAEFGANEKAKDILFAAVSTMDLTYAKTNFENLNIIAQHAENKPAGSTTGWNPADSLIAVGIEYSIFNHSEHRADSAIILEDIKAIQSKGIKLIVCCENVAEAQKLLEAEPFALAYEPKDLIGSGISVTTRPEAVREFIDAVKGKTKVLIGAGVSTGEDVQKALELGAEGALLASAFVKAQDPKAKVVELMAPFLK